MKPASFNRFNNLMNIGLKKKDHTVKPVESFIQYMDPAHTVCVTVFHSGMQKDDPKRSFIGKEETDGVRIPFVEADAEVQLSVDLLCSVIDNLAKGTTCKISAKTDSIMLIEGLLDSETLVQAWIAPRIERE